MKKIKITIVLFLSVLSYFSIAQPLPPSSPIGLPIGEIITWDGSESTNWHDAANWDKNVVPTSALDVIIPVGLNTYPILSSGGACKNLTIESSSSSTGSLTGQSNLVVSGTITIKRHLTGNVWHMISSPVLDETISDFLAANTNVPASESYRGMMDYNEQNNDWNTFFTNSQSGNLTSGKGFSLRTDADGTVTFTGTLTTGTVNTTVARTGNYGWNCVGNPYPSAISINTAADNNNNFIALNTGNLDESYTSVYVWEQGNDAYTIVALGDAAFYAQLGQAFFVKAANGATQVEFTTAMQTHQPAAGFKSGTLLWPELKLTASMSGKSSTARLKFNDDMSTGLDVGYDAGVFKSGFDIYTKLIEDNGVDFGLQSLPETGIEQYEIPVGIDAATSGEISFSLKQENFPSEIIPVLNDKQTGTNFTFSTEADIYTTTIDETQGYGRFTLTFSNTTVVDDILNSQSKFRAWYNNGAITILGEITGESEVTVFDVQGRKLASERLTSSNQNRIEVPQATSGVYLVWVKDVNRSEMVKVVRTGN
ncbi:MAG: T9SS type A sorting domain-containing protein [Draconibacterium sp.]